MPGDLTEKLAKAVTLGVLHFVAEESGRHFVSFVANHQVPIRVGELGLHVLISAELIQPANG